MSDDSRLGVNPLSWVDPDASGEDAKTVHPPVTMTPEENRKATTDAGALARIFGPAPTASKEEIMGDGKVKIKETMETAKVIQHLKDLAGSLEAGTLRAEGSENTVVLAVPESMKIEMKVSRKKSKAKLELELEWKDDGSAVESIKISDE